MHGHPVQATYPATSTLRNGPAPVGSGAPAAGGFVPRAPESLQAAGLTPGCVEDPLLRGLHVSPQSSGAQLAAACGLSFHTIGPVLDSLRQEHLVEIRGQRGIGEGGYCYVLTSKGSARALEAMERTQYRGPLPVSIDDYIASVKAQPIDTSLVTVARVREAFAD